MNSGLETGERDAAQADELLSADEFINVENGLRLAYQRLNLLRNPTDYVDLNAVGNALSLLRKVKEQLGIHSEEEAQITAPGEINVPEYAGGLATEKTVETVEVKVLQPV